MRIIWSPLAIDRASEITDYIAQDKPSAAEKWIDTVAPGHTEKTITQKL